MNEHKLYNIDAEQAILGSLIMNNDNYYQIQDNINSEMFYHQVHGDIFNSISKLINSNLIADPVSITQDLKNTDWFNELGGKDFLNILNENTSKVIVAKTYVKIVAEMYQKRLLVDLSTSAVNDILQNETKATDEVINDLSSKLLELNDTSKSDQGFRSLEQSSSIFDKAMEVYKSGNSITGVETGFESLDELTGGLKGGKLYILGARPAMGKSAFAFNVAQQSAENGKRVGIFSLEMGRDEIKTRLISGASGIDQDIILKGKFENDYQIKTLKQTEHKINKLPIFIDETPALHINQIRARAIKLKRKHKIDMIIVDYLQLCKGNNQNARHLEIGEISMGLKQISKELDIPVIALAQLSRNLESRDDKRPRLSDLRDSGTIEQDADMIMFLHREAYYHDKNVTESNQKAIKALLEYTGTTELIIAKNRSGETKNLKLIFNGATASFIDTNNIYNPVSVDDKMVATYNALLNEEFGNEWYKNKEFSKHYSKFVKHIQNNKEIDFRNHNMQGCSIMVLGAVMSKQGAI